jgi:hypothetical protein
MKFRLMLGTLVAMLLVAGTAGAAIETAAEFLDIVQQRVDRGELTADEALLLKFQYCFNRAKLPADLQPVGKAPMKCATPLVIEFTQRAQTLDAAMREEIEGYITPPEDPTAEVYESPSGRFRLTYQTSGADAVPPSDSDGSGVPDFVENCADYLDYSLDYECYTLGFVPPPFSINYPYMAIYFYDLDGVYGFTSIVSNPPGMTRITLDNDFIGYPPNDDPDGQALGAAKVTCAHEFKHSSQYAGSRWSEQGWVEVDATWMEEIAFPATNDYLNYLPFGSPISSPDQSLDAGGSGSYEDCVWQHYMSQTHGVEMIVDLWQWRRSNFPQPMMDSYEHILGEYGATLHDSWNEFTAWNFATGIRYLPAMGYAEAEIYPAGSPQRTILSYPNSHSGSVGHLAAHFIRTRNHDEPGMVMRLDFNGQDGADLTLAAVVNESYTTHDGAMYLIPLDENNDAVFDIPYDLEGVYSMGIVVGNAAKSGLSVSYDLGMELVPFEPLAVGDEVPAFAITGNYPNPFNPSTTIKFGVDAGGPARLDVYDIAGHKVRTLLDANVGVGEHRVMWNGQDGAGRNVASGTYVARLRLGDRVTTHKLVLSK